MTDVAVRREGDHYLVVIDGAVVDEVYRERQRTDRYPYHESDRKGRGRWRWCAGHINDDDWATRREAVAAVVAKEAARD